MQLHVPPLRTHTPRPNLTNTRFSAPRLFSVFSSSFIAQPITFLLFLSKDIHQRNMAPPSPVTPSARVSSLNQRAPTAAAAGGGGEAAEGPQQHCTHPSQSRCRFYLAATLNIQHAKRPPREFPLGCLHYIDGVN